MHVSRSEAARLLGKHEDVIEQGLLDLQQLQDLTKKKNCRWLHLDQDFSGVPRAGSTPTPSAQDAMLANQADVRRIQRMLVARPLDTHTHTHTHTHIYIYIYIYIFTHNKNSL